MSEHEISSNYITNRYLNSLRTSVDNFLDYLKHNYHLDSDDGLVYDLSNACCDIEPIIKTRIADKNIATRVIGQLNNIKHIINVNYFPKHISKDQIKHHLHNIAEDVISNFNDIYELVKTYGNQLTDHEFVQQMCRHFQRQLLTDRVVNIPTARVIKNAPISLEQANSALKHYGYFLLPLDDCTNPLLTRFITIEKQFSKHRAGAVGFIKVYRDEYKYPVGLSVDTIMPNNVLAILNNYDRTLVHNYQATHSPNN